MSETLHSDELRAEDRHLVDLVSTALTDPNLHTDMCMCLRREIPELVRATHSRTAARVGDKT
jgi:hypothetical protein